MTITFDLNTREPQAAEWPLWESSPLDTVMMITAQLAERTKRAAIEQQAIKQRPHIRSASSDFADDDGITWEDAEWQ